MKKDDFYGSQLKIKLELNQNSTRTQPELNQNSKLTQFLNNSKGEDFIEKDYDQILMRKEVLH